MAILTATRGGASHPGGPRPAKASPVQAPVCMGGSSPPPSPSPLSFGLLEKLDFLLRSRPPTSRLGRTWGCHNAPKRHTGWGPLQNPAHGRQPWREGAAGSSRTHWLRSFGVRGPGRASGDPDGNSPARSGQAGVRKRTAGTGRVGMRKALIKRSEAPGSPGLLREVGSRASSVRRSGGPAAAT